MIFYERLPVCSNDNIFLNMQSHEYYIKNKISPIINWNDIDHTYYTKINKIYVAYNKKILKITKYIFKFHFYFSIYHMLFKKWENED